MVFRSFCGFGGMHAFYHPVYRRKGRPTMTEERNDTSFNTVAQQGTQPWVRLAMIALAAVSILGAGVGWGAITRARSSEQALAMQSQVLQRNQQNVEILSQRLSQSEETNAQLQNGLN